MKLSQLEGSVALFGTLLLASYLLSHQLLILTGPEAATRLLLGEDVVALTEKAIPVLPLPQPAPTPTGGSSACKDSMVYDPGKSLTCRLLLFVLKLSYSDW